MEMDMHRFLAGPAGARSIIILWDEPATAHPTDRSFGLLCCLMFVMLNQAA
jgi:hypothetical protein